MKKNLFIVLAVLLLSCLFVSCSSCPEEKGNVIYITLYNGDIDGTPPSLSKTVEINVSGISTFGELTLNIECVEVFGSGVQTLVFDTAVSDSNGTATYIKEEKACQLYKTNSFSETDQIISTDSIVVGTTYCGAIGHMN